MGVEVEVVTNSSWTNDDTFFTSELDKNCTSSTSTTILYYISRTWCGFTWHAGAKPHCYLQN